ncbi:hypothetical protein [Pseudomonas sp. MF7451]|uniref:hypothetical protein n=1 Tax=Pseudomonas sp. MF7451 TaxID=2797538 RepID=UPI0018E81DC7|nr:hypothetical protein [Pseudomonas sp. MF7451]MBJ2223968.1 hypothetical protein [Pseudomonas sp. MF7451]
MVKMLSDSMNVCHIIGEIDMQALRQFQSNECSLSGPLKPVPNGFTPAHARKTLPKGGE